MKTVFAAVLLISVSTGAMAAQWTKPGGTPQEFYALQYQCMRELPQQQTVFSGDSNDVSFAQLMQEKHRDAQLIACINAHGWFLR
jgi:hypothetical protein